MRSLNLRGASLVELLVALALFGVLATAVTGLLRRTQDVYRDTAQEIDLRQSLRVAVTLLPAELRELDAVDSDVVAMAQAAVTIRAARQLAILCRAPDPGAPAGTLSLTLRAAPFFGLRDLRPGSDSLWLFADGDARSPDDDAWIPAALTAISPEPCPDGGPGRRVSAQPRLAPGETLRAGQISAGAPVLGFETVTYRLYRSSSDGRWYVGQQVAADLQPVLGPVTSEGLAFTYRDSVGALAGGQSQVRLIEVAVRVRSVGPVRTRDGRLVRTEDSVHLAVALRNNPRF
jgi:prepilin-type N-terminal cleavage/methylation domain-containing protein